MKAHLVTIPFSHYCEKARWALSRGGIPFTEEAHLPMLHTRATRPLGGRSTPLLVIDDAGGRTVLPDSTDILHWVDRVATRGAPLFPEGDSETVRLEARFDDALGPHARRLGYFELLQDDHALKKLVKSSSVPALEKTLGVPALPIFKVLLRRALKINAEGAARSDARVREVFAEVEALLSDGRKFLTGDRFTAADLTFAALAAPVVVPTGYQRWLLPLSELSSTFRARVDAWRSTRAGAFAVALYDSERGA